MRFPTLTPFLRGWPLLAIVGALLAVLAVSWSGTNPATAGLGYQPDEQVVADVQSYARETQHGYDHVLRWMRVLKTFRALEDMTAAEAQGYADTYLAERWDPVVTELTALESAQGDYDPDQQVIDDVKGYAQETQHGYDHVLRWMRALNTLGALDGVTAAEAQGFADTYSAERWDPVVVELTAMEANSPATGAPTISGTARVGQALTADTSGISDPDGLANATYTYQWLADDAAISGATASSYTLASADEGKAVKVRVSFTDDEGNDETLTSAATSAVAAAATPPAKPAGLTATATAGSLDVAVDWDDVAGATDYLVRWRLRGPDQDLNDGVRPTSSETQITVSAHGSWVVQVAACDDGGCGPGAARAVEVTPGQPTNLALAATAGALSLAATWDAVVGADTYLVEWRRFNGNFAAGDRVDTAKTNAAITVAGHGRWVVRVLACAGGVCGPGVTQAADVTSAQPTSLAVAATAGELDLAATWDAVVGADTYVVQWRRFEGNFETGDRIDTAETNAAITVAGHGRWVVRVLACAGGVCGPGATQAANIRPAQPTSLAVAATAGKLDLAATWDAVSGAESYLVEWRRPDGNFETGARIGTAETSAAITVAGHGRWVVRVEACNNAGCGRGAARTVEVAAPARLDLAPALDAAGEAQPRFFTASWEAVAGVTSYQLRWRLAEASFQGEDQVSADAAATTAEFSVAADGAYQVQLRGDGGDGLVPLASAEMAVYSYRPGHLSLHYNKFCHYNRITGIEGDPVDGGVEVRWNNPGDPAITKYQYHLQKGKSFRWETLAWTDAESTDAATTSYTITGLGNGATYGVVLRAVAGSETYCFDTMMWVTPSDPTINPPTGFRADPVAGDSGSVKLSWDDPGDSSLSYEHEYDATGQSRRGTVWRGLPWTAIDGSDITVADGRMSAIITGLTCPYGHQFQIRARSGDAIGPLSRYRYVIPGNYLTDSADIHTIENAKDCVFGQGGDDTLTGGAGHDWLYGGAGRDTLNGGGGDDWLYGGAGRDTLNGGSGQDWIYGGDDDDAMYGDDGNDYLTGREGNDEMHGGAGSELMFGRQGDDKMYGDDGNDILQGGFGNDILHGGAGNDRMYGSEGDDEMYGDDGNDSLDGFRGNDILHGGAGNDRMYGSEGDDKMYGGDGGDKFVFRAGFGSDAITDYTLADSQDDSEKILLCMGTETNLATYSGADSGSDHVITVTFDGTTQGTITLKWITTGNANFANRNVIAAAADSAACSS